MARDVINTWIRLERIHCYDEADSVGSAEPYLWTVFFRIDGSDVVVTEALKLSGLPTVHATPGSHGNLGGDNDVDAGDNISIPSAIGEWKTLVSPIRVPDSVKPLLGEDDLPGIVGVACVLMEEDNVSDAGAEAGHHNVNTGLIAVLERIIATRTFANREPSEAEIEQFTEEIAAGVEDAIAAAQGTFQNIWSFLNADDQIGSKVFFWNQDKLQEDGTIGFSQRWKNEGDWEIFGHVSATVACPANALGAGPKVLGSILQASAPKMREFRDREFAGTGLTEWWALAERNAPELRYCLWKDDSATEDAAHLLEEIPNLLDRRTDRVPDEFLDRLDGLLRALREAGGRQARRDAALAQSAVSEVRGMTTEEALSFLGSRHPAKRPGKRPAA